MPVAGRMVQKQYNLFLSWDDKANWYLSSPTGQHNTYVTGTTPLADGRWHHVAAVRDAQRRALYLFVDGQFEGAVLDSTAGPFISDQPFHIGAYYWQGRFHDFYQGDLARVRVWGRALTVSEAQRETECH